MNSGFVVALYEGEWFSAEAVEDQNGVNDGYTKLSFMTIKGKNQFTWVKQDLCDTLNEDILMQKNIKPIPVNNRGFLRLCKKDLDELNKKMVVYHLILKISFYFFAPGKLILMDMFRYNFLMRGGGYR